MFDQILQDIRYGIRGLRRSPGFACVAIVTLALGIGANTAIFSVIDAVLLRPLPYASPGQLVRVYETEDAPGNYPFTGPDFIDWKNQNHSFQDMTLYSWGHNMNLSGAGEPDHVVGVPTESNFFSLLGARPLLGRTWAAGEDEPGQDRVAILSFGLWQSHFAGDNKIVGKELELESQKYTVVGVMPAGFHYPSQAQLWVPQDMDAKSLGKRGNHFFSAIGRLKPGVTLQQAQTEMSLIAKRLEQQYPDANTRVGASLVELHDDQVGESRKSLVTTLWAVALVLLIACANVANLLLSRAAVRQKEMAIRGALGAARIRLIRQLLTESVLLAAIGALLGLSLASAGIRIITSLKHLGLPQQNAIEINPVVLGFTLGLAVLTGIIFGIVPALQISRPDLYEPLRGGAGSSRTPHPGRRSTSDMLVIAEMGLSLLLLIAAGCLMKDFMRLRNSNTGVRPQGVSTAAIALPQAKYSEQQQKFNFEQGLLNKVQGLPRVESAAISDRLPLEGGSNSYVAVRGRPFQQMSGPLVENHSVTPDYFRVMGVPLLEGRMFTEQDMQTALTLDQRITDLLKTRSFPDLPADVTNAMVYPSVINHSMAKYFWKDEDAIGKLYSFGNKNGPWRQVVGVVGDVKQWGLTHEPQPEGYDAFDGGNGFFVVVHSSSRDVIPEIRETLKSLDSSLPLFQPRTMNEVIAQNASGEQFLALLMGLFSGLALLLAAVGIYGVLSYLVTQRTREIGIRMSLGASRINVLTLVLKQGIRLAGIGFALGLVGAFAAGRLLAGVLHDVKPYDPQVMLATASCLALVALVACYVPARRAGRIDPMTALRHD
jgi:putative ABC transport system permease protein